MKITIAILLLLLCSAFTVHASVSSNFAQVIDAATYNYTQSDSWKNFMAGIGILFAVPDCNAVEFPSFFNFSKTQLNLCYDLGASPQRVQIHEQAGKLLVQTINKKYNMNIKANFVQLNISQNGYFNTLVYGVNNNTCDVAIASTTQSIERTSAVHFNCK